MTFKQTTLERAFELARTGEFRTVSELSKQLKIEGYNLVQIEGDMLKRQLRGICEHAQTRQPAKQDLRDNIS
ncbi:hypothetical protein ASE17_20340 [Phenylobacterium sp. Root77]|jgi:hypothetical protein|uniref:hypothetical protein n=1 Tax=unclassified Phenylobacterium TaxID=2640670 RepID=UPI0007013671|nr:MULTISPECIES: hypothetical protein [unclassified Phenylobacterium]KQW67071.1 hypothetical protein ASC73_18265 [Phenylobacterium sp. Root1277]KQW89764.1 hypothetical protein ASC79_19170 [Phenylobacterium sp. Root1290]KRC43547.1 hypothetical protein ASE17_20340 [Phenylobacterium sp. Root77]